MSEPISAVVLAGIAGTLTLFRLAGDLIVEANNRDTVKRSTKKEEKSEGKISKGSFSSLASINGATAVTEATSLLGDTTTNTETGSGGLDDGKLHLLFQASLVIHVVLCMLFMVGSAVYSSQIFLYVASAFLINAIMLVRGRERKVFGTMQRFYYFSSSVTMFLSGCMIILSSTQLNSKILIISMMVYPCLVGLECHYTPYPATTSMSKENPGLSREKIRILLKPYIWPNANSKHATRNRLLVMLTWFCVAAAKVCNLMAPVFLGKASTALTRLEFARCIDLSIYFVILSFFGKFFKEGQGLAYLKVAQAAFVTLSEAAFHHLHTLSLDWHLQKKLGQVIRSMDRGIGACDTLMKYMFLWMIPALVECVLVCIIFATYFNYTPLSVSVFFFVFVYIVMTIVMTLWRKKFRKEVTKSDNAWHDQCTDSLLNFETVKYFTAETHEMNRFGALVSVFQKGTVKVQGSLSVLNISQQVLYQACLATCLSLAVMGIKKRIECCVEAEGCGDYSDISDINGAIDNVIENASCCNNISKSTCPGMEVGDFVAVLTYTINLFGPLNYLGSVYNAIVMAVVDLTNLSELMAEKATVKDMEDATVMPALNTVDPSVSIEFEDVYFHYPTQAENSGLKGMSFKMKRGETTAIVGSTGAGKTTVSRLLFRFYDVLHGAVKVNGVDIRAVTQHSLRDTIGFVPQATTLFNDTIRHNIMYGRRDATQADLDQVVRDAQLSEFISSLPLGWDTLVGDRGLKLSGGEKQRVAIARCLLKNPPVVVLDEATSALDTLTENSVQAALDRLGEDRTCLVIAHRLGTIRNADNIVVLDDGVVAEQGSHGELLEMDGLYASMWNMQLHNNNGDADSK